MRRVLQFQSNPNTQPPAVWQGDAYIRISVKLDQTLRNMAIQRQMIKSWVNALNTARPLPSVWASALHNCFCVCWAACVCTLFIDSLHTLGMSANGEAALFITHLSHTRNFFLHLHPSFTPSPHVLIQARTQTWVKSWPLRLTDQLIFEFILIHLVYSRS